MLDVIQFVKSDVGSYSSIDKVSALAVISYMGSFSSGFISEMFEFSFISG